MIYVISFGTWKRKLNVIYTTVSRIHLLGMGMIASFNAHSSSMIVFCGIHNEIEKIDGQ